MGRSSFFALNLMAAKPPEWARAHELYQRTEYQQSLNLLNAVRDKDSDTLQLSGQDYFMLGEYKRATEVLDKALALGNAGPQLYLWLGRAYGRRAETSSPFTAPGYASHAQKMFEKAVELDLSNKAAVGDLFDYYMAAPGFLGGGLNKAEALAQKVAARGPGRGQLPEGADRPETQRVRRGRTAFAPRLGTGSEAGEPRPRSGSLSGQARPDEGERRSV